MHFKMAPQNSIQTHWSKRLSLTLLLIVACLSCFANENLFKQARGLQREGRFDEAIEAFKDYLTQPMEKEAFTNRHLECYSEALMQLMNTYQSKGEPEACIITLREVLKNAPIIQDQCLRDYNSVLGYALSRTENMKEAEETMLKALTLPLTHPTPERYFRDYAYAAAVFYSNPKYQKEVINWCKEALHQADLCKNTSGKQWVSAMLGTRYKRNGLLKEALDLFQQSIQEAQRRNDDLGELNSLHALVDLFLYWETPEFADIYASNALQVENSMNVKNAMVSAQTYINKGWVMHKLGKTDSVAPYAERARQICQSLPYNSGMVDVNLLRGTHLTELGGDSLLLGIKELQIVAQQATTINRAKAYHQLAQTYLKQKQPSIAEAMLDSMYMLLHLDHTSTFIRIDYQPILNHYLKTKNYEQVERYTRLLLQERTALKEKRLNLKIVESIVEMQTTQKQQDLTLTQLRQTNQILLLFACIAFAIIVITIITMLLLKQRKQHIMQMKQADEKLSSLEEQLNQSNAEKEIRAQEIKSILDDKDKRQELETFSPSILQTSGESKFRQCFELLYPLFIPRLREKVPSITRREELLSMLIVLKQDNKRIAELLAIAPRSVLMLRHRFRQKIGITTNLSLEEFIEDTLGQQRPSSETSLHHEE